ncbi:cytochrome P450 [Psychroflexus salis]|uniref:cytochrome P450 n=1 Tax=Psychroflexus salis TaxID=1526574 RepID=UPI001E47B0A7|nr:cytochrome P450 [Psychroflexus salis]
MKKLPQVPAYLFLKNSLQILKNPLPFHHRNFEKLGDTFQLNLGLGKHVVFSRDQDLAILALQKQQKDFIKSPIQTKDLVKYVGKGLLTVEGEEWKTQRKLLQPTFYKKNIYQLLDLMQDAIVKQLQNIKTDQPIDVFPIFNDLAFKVVAKSLFSDAISNEQISRLQYITEEAQNMLVKELRQPYKKWWFIWSGELKKKLLLTKEALQIIEGIITKRRKQSSQKEDLLDMLLHTTYEDGSSMTHEKLLDEILILFIAGHETTSNALSFTTQLIARNPDVQQKLIQEVDQNKLRTPLDVLKNSPFTTAVIEESMRLYPPVYFIDRVNTKTLKFKDYTIPKNTSLLFSLYEMHRKQEFWEEPLNFIPERFLNGKNHAAYYFPFGAGPRKCIGNNFAMYEIILVMQELFAKYQIEFTNQPIEILPLISLKPKNAILHFNYRK